MLHKLTERVYWALAQALYWYKPYGWALRQLELLYYKTGLRERRPPLGLWALQRPLQEVAFNRLIYGPLPPPGSPGYVWPRVLSWGLTMVCLLVLGALFCSPGA